MTGGFVRNVAQRGDALELLRSLPDAYSPLVFCDPQHRSILDRQQYGNEGRGRQQARCALPQMSDELIDDCYREAARAIRSSGYFMSWSDDYRLLEGYHLRFADVLKGVALIAWDSARMGMGYRTRNRGDYLIVLQKPPTLAKKTWTDHGIPNRWVEKVDRSLHPHVKPIGLIRRLIAAVTQPGDLVVDPCAGSFVVMRAAHQLGREFIGVDLTVREGAFAAETEQTQPTLTHRSTSSSIGAESLR